DGVRIKFFLSDDKASRELRRAGYQLLVEEEWNFTIRNRNYISTLCLEKPSDSTWMVLYK
ncbi:hypothetical protein L917_06823, partial [Phytophthora nicotianae]